MRLTKLTCLGEMAGPRLASRASSYHSEPDKGQHASSVLEMMQKVLCGVPSYCTVVLPVVHST